jgi:hypothetical protein
MKQFTHNMFFLSPLSFGFDDMEKSKNFRAQMTDQEIYKWLVGGAWRAHFQGHTIITGNSQENPYNFLY